jgi:hypothetical protein
MVGGESVSCALDFHQTSINATKNQAVDDAADSEALLKTHMLPNVN